MPPTYSNARYTAAGIIAILFWSTNVAFSRSLTEQLGTLTSAALIYTLAGIAGLLLSAILQPGSLRALRHLRPIYLFGCGGLFVIYIFSFYLAVGMAANHAQVLAVGLINYLWTGLSLAFSVPLLHKRAHPWLWGGILLALIGVGLAVISAGDPSAFDWGQFFAASSLIPYLLALVAGITWALYSTLSRVWGGEAESSAVPLFLLVSGLLVGLARLFTAENTHLAAFTLPQLAYMAFFPAMLAYTFWDVAMRKGNLVLVASLSYLIPLFSTLFSSLLLGITPHPLLWLGAAFIILGALLGKSALQES